MFHDHIPELPLRHIQDRDSDNLAFHNVDDWQGNIYLMLHEFAHHAVQSNDHLNHRFYRTVNQLAAKLVKLAQSKPELFPMQAEADTSAEIERLMARRFRGVAEVKEEEEDLERVAM